MLEKVRTRSVYLMISHAFIIGATALAYFILAAILEPEVFGALFFFITIVNFILAVSLMGFQHVLMHQVPRLTEKNSNSEITSLVYDSWSICVTIGFLLSIALCIFHFFIMPIPMVGADIAVLYILAIAPIWAFLRIAPTFILSRGGTVSGTLPDQGMHALGLLIMPVIAYLGLGLLNNVPFLLFGQIITGIVGALITYYYVKKYFKELGRYQFNFWKPLKKWNKLNLPFFAFSLSQQAVQRLDLIIVGILAGATQLAIYALALKIAQLLYFPAMATRAALAPRFSALFEKNDHSSVSKLLLSSSIILAIITSILAILLYSLSPFALQFLNNVYLKDSLQILIPLIAAEFIISVFTPVKLRFLMGRAQKYLSLIFFLGLITSVALNIYYIPSHGIEAAAYIRVSVMLAIHLSITLRLLKKS